MQNTIYQWFFCVCLLFLPIITDAKIDTRKPTHTPVENPVFRKTQRYFQTANPLDRLRFLKKGMRAFKKSQNTEGGITTEKEACRKRIFGIILYVILGFLLVYWLQGTIWLALVTLAIFAYLRNRNTISNWERQRYERLQNPQVVVPTNKKPDETASLNHFSNKFTRRAINRFIMGAVASVIAFIFIVLSLISSRFGILGILLFITALVFTMTSFINGLQAIVAKEPQSDWAWLVVILSVLLTLLLMVLIFAIGLL